MKLLFVRHGQTDYNKNKVLQGQEKDPPLNEEGIKQVEATRDALPRVADRIISSTLLRARQTAQIINQRLQLPIELRDDIKEFSMGSLAGKTWEEIIAITGDKDAQEHDRNVHFDYSPYGGESADAVKRRVEGFVEEMKGKYPDETILVAAHGGMIDTMHILYPQIDRPFAHNASLHEFDF